MCENVQKIAVCTLILQKWHPNDLQTFIFLRSYFYLAGFGQVRGNLGKGLGEIWAKIMLEVCFDYKKCEN